MTTQALLRQAEFFSRHATDANQGKVSSSQTGNDPYGKNGPLPPGKYDVVPDPGNYGKPSITDPDDDPGCITTPASTPRDKLRIEGTSKGGGKSDGCVVIDEDSGGKDTAEDIRKMMERNECTDDQTENCGTTIEIRDAPQE